MIRHIIGWLRWRPTPQRVRARAHRLILGHGDAALFRAFDGAARAHGGGDRRQARFWEAVARDVARQLRRNAILSDILAPTVMCARGARDPGTTEPPIPPEPPPAARVSASHQGPTFRPDLRLVHSVARSGASEQAGTSGRSERSGHAMVARR